MNNSTHNQDFDSSTQRHTYSSTSPTFRRAEQVNHSPRFTESKLLLSAGISLAFGWSMTLVGIIVLPTTLCKDSKDKTIVASYSFLFISLCSIFMSLLFFITYVRRLTGFLGQIQHPKRIRSNRRMENDPTDNLTVIHSQELLDEGIENVLSTTFRTNENTRTITNETLEKIGWILQPHSKHERENKYFIKSGSETSSATTENRYSVDTQKAIEEEPLIPQSTGTNSVFEKSLLKITNFRRRSSVQSAHRTRRHSVDISFPRKRISLGVQHSIDSSNGKSSEDKRSQMPVVRRASMFPDVYERKEKKGSLSPVQPLDILLESIKNVEETEEKIVGNKNEPTTSKSPF